MGRKRQFKNAKEQAKAYYKRNVDKYKSRQKLINDRNKKISDAFKNKPCADCGVQYIPYVMDYDHVRGEKVGNISDMIRSHTVEKLLAEIEKCDVVCANCHRIRTFNRLDFCK